MRREEREKGFDKKGEQGNMQIPFYPEQIELSK